MSCSWVTWLPLLVVVQPVLASMDEHACLAIGATRSSCLKGPLPYDLLPEDQSTITVSDLETKDEGQEAGEEEGEKPGHDFFIQPQISISPAELERFDPQVCV